ncbi:MAG: CcoQ/FixQ family Cbb3-type cytochrome c oxidase assembly chaperone [Gammaproteobacteria bacterium]|nr:MAG: CcoQ/FixQ family Cbb3-type cytochrome c oxidase assembly chaperone [Gammaproteobacteria bacterium]
MDINVLRGAFTVVMLITFLILFVWAFSPKRKASFDEAANLPFADPEIKNEVTSDE